MSTVTPSPLTSDESDLLLSMSDSDLDAWLTRHPPETQATIRRQLSRPVSESGERPWIVTSRGLVAEFFNVSTQTVKDWKSNGMPGAASRWDLKAIRMWQDRRREQNAQSAEDRFAPIKGEILQEDYRHKKLKNDELAGELMLVSEARRAVVAWAVKLRSRIMSIPGDLVLLVPGELKAIIKAKSDNTVRLALKEASDTSFAGLDVRQMIIDEAERLQQQPPTTE